MARPLNPKQERFVKEYLVDLNATQAARRAGYSARTAKQQGARLLTHVDVAAAVERGKKKDAEAATMSRERALELLTQVAEAHLKPGEDARLLAQGQGALAQLRAMRGWDEPHKSEVGGPGDFDSKDDAELDAEVVKLTEIAGGKAAA